jgi:hypothetical protein
LHAIEEAAGAAGYFSKSGDLQPLIDRLLAVQKNDFEMTR